MHCGTYFLLATVMFRLSHAIANDVPFDGDRARPSYGGGETYCRFDIFPTCQWWSRPEYSCVLKRAVGLLCHWSGVLVLLRGPFIALVTVVVS